MSYHCGGTTASCYQHPSLPFCPPPCVPCPKHKTQTMAKDFISSKKPLLDMLEEDRLMKIRIKMENLSHERKIQDNAKFKMKLTLADAEIDLENRRDKLKTMLENEQECLRHEIIDKFEAKTSTRIDDMREKVRKLREEKEIQQKKVVEEKLNRVFESQCDEMRSLLSKRLSREIAEDWNEQLKMERRLQCELQEEERMWAVLNEEDMNERYKREQVYQERRDEFSKKALEEMNKQLEFKRIKKANLAKVAEREREMIEADLATVAAEKKRQKEEKSARFHKAKEQVKDMLETRNYYRDRKLKREEIVACEFLKKAVRELYVEQEDRDKRKKDLMRAITIYRDYLRKWNCLENSREDALQRIVDGVIEEQHEKVMASRKREHDQRRLLFQNVLAGRKLQIEDLERKRDFEKKEYQKEVEMLKEDWKVYLREMDMEKAQRVKNSQQYKSDLDCQSAYATLIKKRESDELRRQDEMGEIEEKLFHKRLQTTVQTAELMSSNPYRLPLVGKSVRQCYCPVPGPKTTGNAC